MVNRHRFLWFLVYLTSLRTVDGMIYSEPHVDSWPWVSTYILNHVKMIGQSCGGIGHQDQADTTIKPYCQYAWIGLIWDTSEPVLRRHHTMVCI